MVEGPGLYSDISKKARGPCLSSLHHLFFFGGSLRWLRVPSGLIFLLCFRSSRLIISGVSHLQRLIFSTRITGPTTSSPSLRTLRVELQAFFPFPFSLSDIHWISGFAFCQGSFRFVVFLLYRFASPFRTSDHFSLYSFSLLEM